MMEMEKKNYNKTIAVIVFLIITLLLSYFYRDVILRKIAVGIIKNTKGEIRKNLLTVLSHNSDRIFLRTLLSLVSSRDKEISSTTSVLLIESVEQRYGNNRPELYQYVQRLEGFHSDKDDKVRYGALFVLWRLKFDCQYIDKKRLLKNVLHMTKSGNKMTVFIAAEMLGKDKLNVPVEELINLLDSSYPNHRAAALYALQGRLKPEDRYSDKIIGMLRDKSPWVRSAAAWCIGLNFIESADDELLKAVDDSSEGVRIRIITALCMAGSSDVYDKITAKLIERYGIEKNDKVRRRILENLEHFACDKSRNVIIDRLKNGSNREKTAALQALCGFEDKSDYVELVKEYLDYPDEEVKIKAKAVLEELKKNRD